MGGADLGGRRRDDGRHRRVGHLRPGQHPPDRLPVRAPLRGQPALREGPGVPPGAARRGPHGAAHRRVGRRPGRARRGRHRTPTSPPPPRVAFRPARVNRLLGTDARNRRAARPAGAGRDRDRTGRPEPTHDPGRRRLQAARGRGRRRRGDRGDRPDLAARPAGRGRHRPRRSSGSAATSSSRRPCPTRRCRPTGPSRSSVRDAVRETLAGAGLTEVVTLALVAPADGRAVPGSRRRRARRRAGAATRRPAGHRHQPAVEPALGPAPEPARQPPRGRLDEPPPRPRRRRDLRGRQGLRRPGRAADPRVVAARARADRRRRAAGLGPAGPAVRPRRRQGPRRAAVPPPRAADARRTSGSTDDPNLHPGRAARVTRRRRPRRPAGRAPSGTSSTALDLRAERVVVAELADRGPGRRPADAATASTAPSRHPSVERDLAVIVAADRPAAEVEAAIRRHGGPLLRDVALVRHLPRASRSPRPTRASPTG